MASPRILYINEDYPLPSGGVRAIYRHVEVLRKNGFNAYVVHRQRGFHLTWFTSSAPILYLDDLPPVGKYDVVVLPETFDERPFHCLSNSRRVLNCQNHFYMFRGLAGRRARDRRVDAILSCSAAISRFFQTLEMDTPVHLVPCGIDLTLYRPARKVQQIAFMPRKRQRDVSFIRGYFNEIYPEHRDVPWRSLEDVCEREVADVLSQSAAFLSLSRMEGFGRPALEAMAAGCVVAGFHGEGGVEFASPSNGFWCEDGDLTSCTIFLGQALSLAGTTVASRMIQDGRRTATRYTLEKEETAILAFWLTFLGEPSGVI